MRSARLGTAATVALGLVLGGCSSNATINPAPPATSATSGTSRTSQTTIPPTTMPPTTTPPTTTPPSRPRTHSSTPPPASGAQRLLDGMSEAQRVGQLFMVGSSSTGASQEALSAISDYHVGSVILTGTSSGSVSDTAAVSAQIQAAAHDGARLFVATDQEGGQVQRLQGPGFDTVPSGLQQGALAPSTLRADARRWAAQLREAGVSLDLAPVMDTVPSASFAPSNPPIGALDREYGYDPATVAAHGTAFAQGLADAGIDATIKHFPGLGRVTGNTDTTSGVTDRTTTRHDAYLTPFAAGINAGAPFVMMSTAYYSRLDPDRPAAFSPKIVTGMLRGDLHFGGVVISDDVGAAAQVASFAPGTRAVDFIAAGGDVVLTVSASQIPEMTATVLARARSDAAFRAQVDAAALRVLSAKEARGLLTR